MCIMPPPETEKDVSKLQKAMGWLYLACEPMVTNHFDDAGTPLDTWNLLTKCFADSGMDRELAAITGLTMTRLEDCASMDEFIGKMLEAWKPCTEAKVIFEDRIVALMMIARLGPQYQPFVMSLTGSGIALTVEKVKSMLLALTPANGKAETAFFGRSGRANKPADTNGQSRNSKGRKPNLKCYGCGQTGHYKNKCPSKSSNGSLCFRVVIAMTIGTSIAEPPDI